MGDEGPDLCATSFAIRLIIAPLQGWFVVGLVLDGLHPSL